MNRRIIVNTQDEIIAYKYSQEITLHDIYRVSCLWIFNDTGQILLAKRALTKKHDPGKWEGAVAGTVEEGESYISNIIKETKEELGVTITENDIIKREKLFLDQAQWKFFCQLYTYNWNGKIQDLVIEKKEVMDVKWFSKDEIYMLFERDSSIFVNNFKQILELLI